MSRSSHQRQQQQLLAQQQQQMADNDAAAAAAEMFDMFCLATTMRQVLGLHRNMCDTVGLRPAPLNEFYPKLKAKIRSWKAQALWKKFDARASHRAYSKGNACTGTRVLVIGAGPCGLRTAIEAQLLGAKVVVVEKRDRISRNNVLHLWPFVITDLRNLGAKKFYGKFCAGSIDHISIRQIQCILLKVALLLGVEVHEGVSFEGTIEPSEGCGWRAAISPEDHAVSHYEFDVLIGADGKRNTLEAFKRKEFRGKLAIAITANFINKKTEAEAKAEEISGVAFIFNQAFFKELYHTTGIDLENIVYYKDETHYFVMTAKKHSLIDKGVILQDFADPAELLASQNVNTDKLLDYAREAAEFSTKYQMPNLEFAVNHYGKPDVAMFDFTSMFAAESSSRVIVRKNYRLLQCLVGDSLLEPFWPTGSGCARGFLSSMDAAYAIKLWNNPKNSTLGVLAQRESIYRLLAQTTPENLQRDIGSYTVDPATRYPNLNRTSVNMYQVKHLIDTDDKSILEHTYMDTNALQTSQADTPVRRKRRTGDTLPLSAVLLRWIKVQLHAYEFVQSLNEVSDCFTHGKVLCALINRYRPDLVDFNKIKELPAADSNELAFKILDKELKISRVMSGKDSIALDKIDSKIWLNYLEQICEVFRGEIPHVKHPKLDVSELREKNRNNVPDFSRLLQLSSRKAKSPMQDVADLPHPTQRRSVLDEEKVKRQRKHEPGQGQLDTPRRAKKRRSAEKTTNIEERQQRLKEIEENRQDRQSKRRMQRFQQTQNFYKSLHMLQVNTLLRESDESSPFEDYSIYMYRQQAPIFNDRVKELERKLLYPDRERGISSALPRGADEQFSDRIKSMEQQITSRNAYGTEKKPKDLMRAIGKIDSSDWNVREIEKKIEQSKKTETGIKGREKVPKWSKEQFVARQSKMSKPTRQDSSEEKFKEIDQTLKNLDKQLKEGSVLEVGERGKNKVASIAGQFVKKEDTSEEKNPPTQPIAKSNSKVALAFKKQAASEKCHFCKQTVYLMEKISTEGLIFHRSCLKCHHCHTNLRPGGYAFDRDDPEGRFYCTQHFRLPAKAIRPVVRKPGQRKSTAHGSHAPSGLDAKTPEKPRGITESVVQLDLLDRGQTPERIEFENTDAMSDGEPSEEHIIDENEWSGRNFLQPSADSESDLSSSSDESDDDSESDIFEEANGSPIAQQTLQLATDWIGKQHYSNVNSDDSDDDFYDSSEGLADDGKDDTEGEEIKKAREMRREEVRLLPLPTNIPTDTETENQEQVAVVPSPQDGVSVQKIDEVKDSERLKRETPPPSKADIEKIEQNSDRKLSADVDAISEKLYRLNNLMKLSKDLESMAKENLVKSDILKKLSLKEKWLLDNSGSGALNNPALGFPGEKVNEQVSEEAGPTKVEDSKIENTKVEVKDLIENSSPIVRETSTDNAPENGVTNGDDDRGDGLKINSSQSSTLVDEEKPVKEESEQEKSSKIASEKMEIEGILDFVKLMDISYIEKSKEPLPKKPPVAESPKPIKKKDPGQMIYEAEQKKVTSLSDALHQIEVRSFAGTMDTIKAQMVMPTVSQQATLDISKYFPNAKQEKQSSASLNKTQKTLKDVDLTKYFPQSPVPQRKASVTIASANDKLKKSQTAKTSINESPKVPPRRQKSIAAPSGEKIFSMKEHQLDGAIDIQKAPIVKPVAKKGGIKIVKKIVPKGTKTAKKAGQQTVVVAEKIQDEADKILDQILQSGQEVRSPSLEYQKLFTEEKSPSEDISEKIEKILEETGIDLGLPPNPRKKLTKTKSLGEEEFKRTQEKALSREDGDRPMGVKKILQRFESMSSIKSDDSFKLRKTNLSSTCSSLNKSKESLPSGSLQKSKESFESSGSLKSNSDSMSDLEKTMEYLKSEWKTEATNFLQKKRNNFYASRDEKKVEEEADAKKQIQPEAQWKHTKYSKFFGIKEKSPEKRKSPIKSGSNAKRKSPAKVLKKSPREEIMKHRRKVESVSSRTASFEEKIKAEENVAKPAVVVKARGSQNDLTNGLGSKSSSKSSISVVPDEEVTQNVPSKIPISQNRKEVQTNLGLNKNLLDTAQKVLSRRGSGSSGLADVLKPPVVKGLRGQQENKPKVEVNANELKNSSRRGSQEALKAVLNLVRNSSQSSLNGDHQQNSVSNHSPIGSQSNILAEESSKLELQVDKEDVNTEISQKLEKPDDQQESQIVFKKASVESPIIHSQTESQAGPAGTPPKSPSRRGSQSQDHSEEVHEKTSSRKGSQSNDHSEEVHEKTSSRKSSQNELNIKMPISPLVQSRRGSQTEPIGTPPKCPSRRGSQNQISAIEAEVKVSSRKGSQEEYTKIPLVESRRPSQIETSPQQKSRRESLTETITKTPMQALSRRASDTKEDSKRSSEAPDDVDEIFNKIINEMSKDEEEAFNAAQKLSLVAIAAEDEEQPEEQSEEQHNNVDDSDYIAQIHESPKQSRESSEDSIEELFSQFTNDMLVDVEFDSNDEVVAITPRAVIVNENDDNEEDKEKPITIEEAKLKFEPLFPRQVRRVVKSSSSSLSVSPARAESKTKKIVQKLDPSDMAPSVQDMMQIIIPREESEPRGPVAFPRRIYSDSDEARSSSSVSRNQTPDLTVKTVEPSTKENHLEAVIESEPSPKVFPVSRDNSEQPSSRRGSQKSIENESESVLKDASFANGDQSERVLSEKESPRESPSAHRGSPILLPSFRRTSMPSSEPEPSENIDPASLFRKSSKASLKENEEIILVGSPASLPTPRRGSRASVDSSNEHSASRRNSALLPVSPRKNSNTPSEVELIMDKSQDLHQPTPATDNSRESSKIHQPSPATDNSRESSKIHQPSPATDISRASSKIHQPSPTTDISRASSKIHQSSPATDTSRESSRIPRQTTPVPPPSRRSSNASNKLESPANILREITPPQKDSNSVNSRRGSNVSGKTEHSPDQQSPPQASILDNINPKSGSPKLQTTPRKGSDVSRTSESPLESSRNKAPKALTASPPTEMRQLPSREGSRLSTKSPPRAEGMVQTDSESSSADDVELNSATEISTDSEFDHDEIIREAPKIFIDDTHLRKPTKVQIKQTVIAPSTGQPKYHINNRMTYQPQQHPTKREPQFKPLVQVDPLLLSSNRMPLQNPRPGDYMLNKTASTEGIASKKSLELKKRYLLGEQGNGNKIQKSGSTSILDSKIRSFHSNISECQKLLNAGSMKPFLDRTKASENQAVVDKKIEITIKKTTIDEKENVFVNSKNELNKGMEYSETVNTTLVEALNKNKSSPIIETIDLISPEKAVPIIDLTKVEIPSKMLESNMDFIKNLNFHAEDTSSKDNSLVPDNKIIDLTLESPVKSDKTVIEEVIEIPDVSKDVKEAIPDIITHIEEVKLEKKSPLDHEVEKKDSPEKTEYDIQETSIQVPNIPWAIKKCIEESDSLSSSSSSSVEDIQHFILDSTTSPDTQTGQIVPRLEVHDSSGTLMQIDSLMIIDGKYIGDPEDLKDMEIPPGMIIPEIPTQSPSPEEPITELRKEDSPPPPKPELKFDTKNENKIDTLKNIPLILEKSEDHNRVVKPDSLNINMEDRKADSDNDKTPTADGITRGSDSDADATNQGLTETELSDWTADDAISENFVDLEFVLNSNKGTIKRNKNKKSKKKAPLQSALSITREPELEPEQCGILKNLDIEEIEFMDTGSEGSCAEAYSATNTALLRNRGYSEYMGSPRNYRHNRTPTEHELKTPVNECPTLPSTVLLSQKSPSQSQSQSHSQQISPPTTSMTTTITPPKQSSPSQTQHTTQSLSQSLTDSTNDIDEDSLCMLTNSNGATANNTATITTTTEESEALTVVTSPMDSSSPKTQENFQLTGSSSDPNGKTTSPSSNTTATPATSSSSKGPTRKSSHEDLLSHCNSKRKESEEMSYEEYVRKLQQKITQISNARDSIDVRKQNRRKSSKGEGSEANSVIEGGSAKGLSVFEGGFSAAVQPKVVLATINVTANPSQGVHKVPEIPTLTSKLEELTKERTKQKDLIHDLVMDKLQCKKQLNAEKRLNRSRNRSMFGNNLTSSSLSPTPKMTSANTSPYHVTSSSGGDHSGSSCKENNPLVGQKTKSSPKEVKDVVQMFAEAPPRSSKQRPFSENFEPDSIDDHMCKLSKTQSFTYNSSRGGNFPFKNESNGGRHQVVLSTVYASPLVDSSRSIRKDDAIGSIANADKLRTEARARARLKSNHDLGLSPEEKLQLLRKRYHLDLQEATAEAAQLKAEELRARDRKMVSSKSVNDIATAQLLTLKPDENSNTTTVRSDLVADFTSDPNLSQVNKVSTTTTKIGNRRQKDPERRKSIIQTFSSFFQKGNKKDKDIVGPVSGTEKSGTSQSSAAIVNNNGGGGDGMFSRFRISPKSKEKSKDNGSSPTTPVATTPQHQYRHHHDQRSNSQDCIAKQKYSKISSYASSPQLFKNTDEQIPPPIPPLPLNYQRSDDESYATESREQKKQRAITKATRQAELKRLRIAQEIQREQEEIEVQLKELEARGVLIEKALRGEGQTIDNLEASNMGANDEKLLKELLEIWRNITQLKKRDEELGIRQQELQLEHRHAQLKEELNIRLSGSKLDKSSADVAAEGAILNEMLEIVAKRAALRPTSSASSPMATGAIGTHIGDGVVNDGVSFSGRRSSQIDESDI